MSYQIKPGDTIERIAAYFDLPVETIVEMNPGVSGAGNWLMLSPNDTPGRGLGSDVEQIPTNVEITGGTGVNFKGENIGTDSGKAGGPIVGEIGRQFPGVVAVDDTVIPQGASLIIIAPRGGEAGARYILQYDGVFGLTLNFEIGDINEFERLFPSGTALFENVSTITESQYRASLDDPGVVEGGTVDEIVGSEESLERQIDREMGLLGQEDLAPWMRDTQIMALTVEGTLENWSQGRIWQEYAKTDAFQKRFSALDVYTSQGLTVQEAVTAYTEHEEQLRAGIRRFRGGQFNITTEYLADLIGTGWTADSAIPILEAEARLKRNPDALAQANMILTASGLAPIDESGMIAVMNGYAPPDVTEALNTAAAAQALTEAGLEGVDTDLLLDVIDDTSRLRTADDYQALAGELALNVAKYQRQLGKELYGMTQDKLTRAFFGESDGETFNTLAKIERERAASAAGFDNVSAYIDQRNRLRVQGFGGL